MTLALPTRFRRDSHHNRIIDWLAANVPEYGTEDWCSCYQKVGERPVICARHLRIARKGMTPTKCLRCFNQASVGLRCDECRAKRNEDNKGRKR